MCFCSPKQWNLSLSKSMTHVYASLNICVSVNSFLQSNRINYCLCWQPPKWWRKWKQNFFFFFKTSRREKKSAQKFWMASHKMFVVIHKEDMNDVYWWCCYFGNVSTLYLYIYQSKLTLIDWFLFRILLKKIPLWNLLKKNNNNNKRIF